MGPRLLVNFTEPPWPSMDTCQSDTEDSWPRVQERGVCRERREKERKRLKTVASVDKWSGFILLARFLLLD